MKTNLEIFEEVAAHLLTQNRRATNNDRGLCFYLASNGDKCAVGCLIKKECYVPEVEGHAIHSANPELIKALTDSGIPQEPETYDLLQKLQHIHDNEDVQVWEMELISLRNSFFNSSEKFESQKFMDDLKLKGRKMGIKKKCSTVVKNCVIKDLGLCECEKKCAFVVSEQEISTPNREIVKVYIDKKRKMRLR